jgi:hypothetical protein
MNASLIGIIGCLVKHEYMKGRIGGEGFLISLDSRSLEAVFGVVSLWLLIRDIAVKNIVSYTSIITDGITPAVTV